MKPSGIPVKPAMIRRKTPELAVLKGLDKELDLQRRELAQKCPGGVAASANRKFLKKNKKPDAYAKL